MKARLLVSLILLVAVGLVLWVSLGHKSAGSSGHPPNADAGPADGLSSPAQTKATGQREPEGISGITPTKEGKARILQSIREALEAMRGGNPGEIERTLAKLGGMLREPGDRAAAIAAIVEFLGTGEDARTGKGFVVGEGGVLAESSTLRVYLMDWLGQLCGSPTTDEALEVARGTLASFGSADEWAISMRNFAWAAPERREFLVERVNAMIRHPQWQEHPSTGMLEAYDVIVHTKSLDAVPELARQISKEESPLGRASGVALDRLASSYPLELTSLLNQQRDLMAATPLVRADLFAHADVAVPEQRAQLETYLLRPDVDAVEREKFFSSLIQTGQFVSHNLLTPYIPPEEPEQAAVRLGKLVETVNGWMRDGRFAAISGELATFGEAVNGIVDEISADEAAGGQK
ncbi:MAG: hypothetical protein EOP88_02880 [Verrucomicrobiaceae bacterium]|nr:MAG: hypothetical protein EOP88_02880 [Verrucomicrobiaceae bacterium]